MIRSLVRVLAASAFAALIAPAAPSAAQAPGIAFDEIVRVLASASPPPPGDFAADLASVDAAPEQGAAATPAPRRRGILGVLVEELARGGASASSAVRTYARPRLLHYAYWNGWVRIDDVAAQTATIRKCDLNQVVTLDLARKTYRVVAPDDEPTVAPFLPAQPTPAPRRGRPEPVEAEEPGTAAVALSETTTSLGTVPLEGRPASGYDTVTTVATTAATGSCRDGSETIRTVQYLAPLARPTVNLCPIRPAPLPEDAAAAVTRTAQSGTCRPTFTADRSGPVPPSGRLPLYALVTFDGSLGFLTERGNLRALGPGDAALFAVPADFTAVP